MRSLWERFHGGFGSPITLTISSRGRGHRSKDSTLLREIITPPAYDSKIPDIFFLLVSDSSNPTGPVQVLNRFTAIQEGQPEQRGNWSRLNLGCRFTGIKADEWIPTPPGTEGLVALAIASMIIREALYNKEFWRAMCSV